METAGVVPTAVETDSDGTVAAETADLNRVAKESANRDLGQPGTTSDNDDVLQPLVTTSGEASQGSESCRRDDSSGESKTAVARDDTAEDGSVSGESSPGRSVNGRCLRWKRDSRFLKNPLYITSLLSAVFNMGTSVCFVFLVLDFAANRGWSFQDGLDLNFAFMLSSLIGRVLLGFVSLHDGVNDVVLLAISGLIGSVALGLVGQVSTTN